MEVFPLPREQDGFWQYFLGSVVDVPSCLRHRLLGHSPLLAENYREQSRSSMHNQSNNWCGWIACASNIAHVWSLMETESLAIFKMGELIHRSEVIAGIVMRHFFYEVFQAHTWNVYRLNCRHNSPALWRPDERWHSVKFGVLYLLERNAPSNLMRTSVFKILNPPKKKKKSVVNVNAPSNHTLISAT